MPESIKESIRASLAATLLASQRQQAAREATEIALTAQRDALAVALVKDPDGSPPPPPPPPPAPVGERPPAFIRNMTGKAVIMFNDYQPPGQQYQRSQQLTKFKLAQQTGKLRVWARKDAAGAMRPFADTDYVLKVSNPYGTVEHEFKQPPLAAGTQTFDVVFPLTDVTEGWHVGDLVPVNSALEHCVPWVFYMQRGDIPVYQYWIPVVRASYTLARRPTSDIRWVPAVFDPPSELYPERLTPSIPHMPTRAEIIATDLVIHRSEDIYRPRVTDGIWNTFNAQPYFFGSQNYPGALINKTPGLPQLDGPRGVGTVTMATYMQFGRNNGIYFCEATRIGHVDKVGNVRTLAGLRHGKPPVMGTHGGPMVTPEMVGDWSGVPANRPRFFHELWQLTVDVRSTATDETATPIPNNGILEKPHVRGPVMFACDTQNNRVCMLQFQKDVHGPAKVLEFITGLADPWGCVAVDGLLFITERLAHRIVVYDIDARTAALPADGALIDPSIGRVEILVFGQSLSTIQNSSSRKPISSYSRERLREEPCQMPEGIAEQDGWIYYWSLIQRQVRRINRATKVIEIVKSYDSIWEVDNNSMFLTGCVSDGTFAPRGQPWTTSWAAANYGFPIPLHVQTNGNSFGPGRPLNRSEYGAAVCQKEGKLATASMAEGIVIFSKALSTDIVITESVIETINGVATRRAHPYVRGRDEYFEKGYHLTHGPKGWGYNRDPLPWRESDDMDTFLIAEGHTRP